MALFLGWIVKQTAVIIVRQQCSWDEKVEVWAIEDCERHVGLL